MAGSKMTVLGIFRHRYVKNIILFGLVGVLLYFFLKDIRIREVLRGFRSVHLVYPLVFCLGLIPQFLIRGYRWGLILQQHCRIPLRRLFHYTAVGYMINLLVPGKAGEPAKGILLAQKAGIPKGAGLASVVIERTLDFIFIFLLFNVSLMAVKIPGNPDSAGSGFFQRLSEISAILLFVFIILLVLFYLINIPFFFNLVDRLTAFCVKIIPRKYRSRVYRFIHDFIKGLRLKLGLWGYIKLILSSGLSWLVIIPFYWFLINGYGFGTPVEMKLMIPWFSLIALSASLPTPMMAGTLDMGSKIAFENILGITDINSIVAFTLFFHFLLILSQLALGLYAKSAEGLRIKSLKKIRDKDNI